MIFFYVYFSALHIAVRRMDWPITAKLIKLGADLCLINSSSRSAIHMMALKVQLRVITACVCGPIRECAVGLDQCVDKLI